MSSLYLVGKRNTGAALFGNSQRIPYLFERYSDAKSYLNSHLLSECRQAESQDWFIKKFVVDDWNGQNQAYVVYSQRLGRGSYKGKHFLVAVFSSKVKAENYVKTNSPQSLIGRFFAEYELSIGCLDVK